VWLCPQFYAAAEQAEQPPEQLAGCGFFGVVVILMFNSRVRVVILINSIYKK